MNFLLMDYFFINFSMLMAAPVADSGLGGLGGFQCIMMIAFIGIFYALLIRPQQQQQKRHAKMVEQLKNGDRVVASGMVGTVITVKQKTITLRTGESKLELMRTSVERVLQGDDDLNS